MEVHFNHCCNVLLREAIPELNPCCAAVGQRCILQVGKLRHGSDAAALKCTARLWGGQGRLSPKWNTRGRMECPQSSAKHCTALLPGLGQVLENRS